MEKQAMFDLLQFSTVMGARALASKVQESILNETDLALSEDEQRILDEASSAASPDPDLQPAV